jgi:hypothetical protein
MRKTGSLINNNFGQTLDLTGRNDGETNISSSNMENVVFASKHEGKW